MSLRTLEKVLVKLKCPDCHRRWQRHKRSKRLWKVCWNGYIRSCQEIRIIFSMREPIRYIIHQDHGEYDGETSRSLIYSVMALFQRSGLTVGKIVTQLSLFMAMKMMESLKKLSPDSSLTAGNQETVMTQKVGGAMKMDLFAESLLYQQKRLETVCIHTETSTIYVYIFLFSWLC